jgi:hypothetical protein
MTNEPKYIKELKDKHKGQDIYVICSGKSCDFIDNSFFDNKVTLGVNQVYRKFKTDYLVRKENNYMIPVIKANPESIHCITVGNCGGNNKTNLDTFIKTKELHDKQVYFIPHLANVHNMKYPTDENQLVVSYSTTTTAIHLAAYMGAANILLVGHDCGYLDGQLNFEGYYKGIHRVQNSNDHYHGWLKHIQTHTHGLKTHIKSKYDCNLYSINPFTNLRLDGHKFS